VTPGLERGGVYRIDLGTPRGHEQRGRRLGIVMSPSAMPWSVATVVPTSTTARAAVFRPRLTILGRNTTVLVDQIRSIDTDYVDGPPVAYLTRDQLGEVEDALSRYLGLVPGFPYGP